VDAVGQSYFATPLATVQLGRWEWRLSAPLIFFDAKHGMQVVAAGTSTNFASIRSIRSASVGALITAAGLSVPASLLLTAPLLASLMGGLGLILLALYAVVAGYGNAASALHDHLYTVGALPRLECDRIFYRALRAEGVARWRAALMYLGVRLGGGGHYWPAL
jgi:hypothetical protein